MSAPRSQRPPPRAPTAVSVVGGEPPFRLGDIVVLRTGSLPLMVVDFIPASGMVTAARKDRKTGKVVEHEFRAALLQRAQDLW